jgi:hypothetical protein
MTKAEVAALAAELAADPEVTTLSVCALKADGSSKWALSGWANSLNAQQLVWGLAHLIRDLLGSAPEKAAIEDPGSQRIQ